MNEPLHDIDKLFQDGIEGHSEYPPKKVWDKIEAGLDKDTAFTYKKKYNAVNRAAAVLLILFLGVIIYEVASRHSGKGDVAGTDKINGQQGNMNAQQNDTVTNLAGKDNIDQTGGKENKDVQSQDQQSNPVLEEKKSLQDNQSPVATGANKISNAKKDIAGTDQKQNNRAVTVKVDDGNSKQKTKNRLAQNSNIDFVVITPGKDVKVKKDKLSADANSPVASTAKQDDATLNEVQIKRAPTFVLISAGLPKKDIAARTMTVVNISENGSASILGKLNYPKVKKSNNPVFRNYGLAVSVFFSPNTSWNSIADDKPYRAGGSGGSRPVDHDEIKKSEQNSFTYSGGIKISYGFSKRMSVQTGLNYTKSTTSVKAKDVYAEQDNSGNIHYRVDCSSGYTYIPPHNGSNPAPGDKITMSDNRNTLSYLGIPLSAEYRISFGKLSVSPSAGGQVNILLKGKTKAVLGKGTSNETSVSETTQSLKSGYFSAIAAITGELQLNKKLSATIAPSGQFGLSSINSGASVKTRPSYIGLAAGLKLKL